LFFLFLERLFVFGAPPDANGTVGEADDVDHDSNEE